VKWKVRTVQTLFPDGIMEPHLHTFQLFLQYKKKLDQHFFIEMIQLFFKLSEIRLQKLNFLNDWNDEKQTGCHTGQPVLFYEVL
jgi:hypothetical protein